ncbi:unnamed protein product [Diplocarpon coronariae]|uniref:Thiamine-monophosphate kinase n=1 Tax=Diplocarpon coronariae TaxID=2795749 RepID=A0A218ZC41_9HELO|nr:hypothetical protein JHW43_008575 [Diplocarpon mali]OWP05314.1 thiamine-monophosphate kinase [Marssonina coronariae]
MEAIAHTSSARRAIMKQVVCSFDSGGLAVPTGSLDRAAMPWMTRYVIDIKDCHISISTSLDPNGCTPTAIKINAWTASALLVLSADRNTSAATASPTRLAEPNVTPVAKTIPGVRSFAERVDIASLVGRARRSPGKATIVDYPDGSMQRGSPRARKIANGRVFGDEEEDGDDEAKHHTTRPDKEKTSPRKAGPWN